MEKIINGEEGSSLSSDQISPFHAGYTAVHTYINSCLYVHYMQVV